jgi:hypothetical protein
VRRIRHIPLLLAALAVLALPAGAAASNESGGKAAIKDCYEDGKLDGHYNRGELKYAHDHLPSDVDEYSDCRSVIDAQLARGGKSNGGGTGGVPGGGFGGPGTGNGGDPSLSTKSGAIAGSKDDLAALQGITHDRGRGAPKIPIAGQQITPAAGAAAVSKAANGLPTPLLAALIGVGAMCLLGAAFATARRWPQLRRVPLRLLHR